MGNTNTKCDFEFGLSVDCWKLIISYLDVRSQVNLAHASKRICGIFKSYGSEHYKHIDEQLIRLLSVEELEQLLLLIGDHVQSYAKIGAGYEFQLPYRRHFEIILANCKQLKRFALYQVLLTPDMANDLTSQLSHLLLNTKDETMLNMFLDAPASAELEGLVLKGAQLNESQMERVCKISSLKELDIRCNRLPMAHFLKLQQLETLHISMPTMTNPDLLELIKGLPKLHNLHLKDCPLIDAHIYKQAKAWIRTRQQNRQKFYIYMYESALNWHKNNETEQNNQLLEIVNKCSEDKKLNT